MTLRERCEKFALEWFQQFDPVDKVDPETVDMVERFAREVRAEAIEECAVIAEHQLCGECLKVVGGLPGDLYHDYEETAEKIRSLQDSGEGGTR